MAPISMLSFFCSCEEQAYPNFLPVLNSRIITEHQEKAKHAFPSCRCRCTPLLGHGGRRTRRDAQEANSHGSRTHRPFFPSGRPQQAQRVPGDPPRAEPGVGCRAGGVRKGRRQQVPIRPHCKLHNTLSLIYVNVRSVSDSIRRAARSIRREHLQGLPRRLQRLEPRHRRSRRVVVPRD